MWLPQPAVCVAQGYPASDPLFRLGTSNVVFGGSDGRFIGTAAIAGGRVFGATMYGDGELGAAPLCRELPQAGSVASAVVPVGDTIVFGTGNSYGGGGASIQAWRVQP